MATEIHPVTADRWDDMEDLFGPSGASGCWCMWWRQTSAEFSEHAGEQNRRLLLQLVHDDRVPGLLLYRDGRADGWCSVAPRSEFGRLNRSPILKPVDELPVWSVACFYVRRGHRGSGLAAALLDGAIEHARRAGAHLLEGYPIDTSVRSGVGAAALYTGTLGLFLRAGFGEVARRSEARPIVRRSLR